ncbi:hypothetical protein [Streptomyces sp. SPB162]|uniref:hypothetical protein n=1 Tax=Streptomyces sp. SPB162 TaxID=2940560 RepID=UPI0024056287|nr:hypothetical protein [Streptomyces sp. SPB162]MDF9816370.1 membrane protein implicated in regulation of membrane protease activity [Streptomyces sp. SPB162]
MTDAQRITGGRSVWLWFTLWAVVGGGFAFCVAALLSVGLFVLPLVVVAAIVVGTRRGSAAGLPGLLTGPGLLLLFLAYLNRSGPGTVCNSTQTACIDQSDPWIWLTAAALMMLASVALMLLLRHARRRAQLRWPASSR